MDVQYLSKKPYNLCYVSTQPFPLSAFMISKTHIVAPKPHTGQLNLKVCGSKSVIFISILNVKTTMLNMDILKMVPLARN